MKDNIVSMNKELDTLVEKVSKLDGGVSGYIAGALTCQFDDPVELLKAVYPLLNNKNKLMLQRFIDDKLKDQEARNSCRMIKVMK